MQYTVTFLAWHICSFCQPFDEAQQLEAAPVQKSIWEEYSGSPHFSKAAGARQFFRAESERVDQHNLMLHYQLGIVDWLSLEEPVRTLSRNTIQDYQDLGVRASLAEQLQNRHPLPSVWMLKTAHTGTYRLIIFFFKSNSREQLCRMFSGILK